GTDRHVEWTALERQRAAAEQIVRDCAERHATVLDATHARAREHGAELVGELLAAQKPAERQCGIPEVGAAQRGELVGDLRGGKPGTPQATAERPGGPADTAAREQAVLLEAVQDPSVGEEAEEAGTEDEGEGLAGE